MQYRMAYLVTSYRFGFVALQAALKTWMLAKTDRSVCSRVCVENRNIGALV